MIRKALIVFAGVLTSLSTLAQQEPQFSQYMQNYFLANPGEGGTEEFIDIKLGTRTQWAGLKGAPKSFFVSGHAPIGKETSRFDDVKQRPFHGVGGYVMRDETGPSSRTSAYASYAYHLPVSSHNDLVVSFGMNAGIKQYQLNEDEIEFYSQQGFNGAPVSDDDAIDGIQTKLVPDITTGIWAYSNHYFVGLSTFQMLRNKVNFYNGSADSVVSDNLDMHFLGTAGYKFDIDSSFQIVPSFVIKAVAPAPVQFDINCKFRHKPSTLWCGFSYRNKDSFIGMVGVTAKRLLDISYSFDLTTSNLGNYNTGSHEIVVGLNLPYHEQDPPPSQFW